MRYTSLLLLAGSLLASSAVFAAESSPSTPPIPSNPFPSELSAPGASSYRLCPNDVLRVKVFQEEDLTTELRLGKDGSATFPLLGVINLGGKTVDEAAATIRDQLGKDFLVNPQVTLTVTEYAKRRFTVLGQVQKPGSYDIPSEESVTLLQAIAMAGGFTRLAVQNKVTITRTSGGKRTVNVDVRSAANDPNTKPFEILADDTIFVAERVF